MARAILITGVSRPLAARVAVRLQADPRVERVIGIDTVLPGTPLGRTELVRVDLRTPDVNHLIVDAGVDTVVHLSLVSAPGGAGGRMSMKEINVIGTMQLFAACQRAATVCRLVVRSTAAVYGASPRDPAMFTEDMHPRVTPQHGLARDATEIEGYVRGLMRRRPDMTVTVLRFTNFVGPTVQSPLTRYLCLPVVPTALGWDPRLQFIHEDDGVEVLRRAALEDHHGTFNATGHGVLMLSQALRRAGRPMLPLPRPGLRAVGELARRVGISDFSPEQLSLLLHGRGVDGTKLERELSWRPAYTTAEAFDDFVRSRGLTRNIPVELFDLVTTRLGVPR